MSRLNVGNIDRVLRILVGLALIGLAATGTIGIWGYIGVIPLVTGLVAKCPLYSALGIATTPRAEGRRRDGRRRADPVLNDPND